MSLPGKPIPYGMAPGYQARQLDNDLILILFGGEEVVGICRPDVTVRDVETFIIAHQACRLEHAAPLEHLMGPDSRKHRIHLRVLPFGGDWML